MSSETINVALCITHRYGKEERLIVMVKKKDGSNRVCADFRKLSKITEVDPEPMTTAEDLSVDSVA